MINVFEILQNTQLPRFSDGNTAGILSGCEDGDRILVTVLPQLGDFDSLEYVWWLDRESARLQSEQIQVRAIGIGDLGAGKKFCDFTGFPDEWLFIDASAQTHQQLELYPGLALQLPGLSVGQNAWLNLMLMCAGIGSPGTLREVLRGYTGDRTAPQLIGAEETIAAKPLPPLRGSFFDLAGGSGWQRPFELATLRLRNMSEVLAHWRTYVPNPAYLTQRGGTFLFDRGGKVLYQHRDRGILGFAANMSNPLSFLDRI
jgi:AhpC/TSA antioxidant enzyme